jgi:ABC-type branched-subunit amino acid transport system substrate-binding protein
VRHPLFRRWLRVPASGMLLAGLVAAMIGCGSDDDSSTASAPPAGTSTSTATKSPVLVGVQTSVGSPVSTHPYTLPATQAAVRAVNARGGLNGHPVKVVFCNDRSDTKKALSCARTLAAKRVIACVGCHSLSDNLVQPILEQAKIPMIAQQAVSSQTFNGSNMYLPTAGGISAYQVILAYAQHRLGGKLGVGYADVPAGQAFQQLTAAVLKAAGGGGFTSKVPVPPTTSDFSPLAALATGGGTRNLLLLLDFGQWQPLTKAIEASGAGSIEHYVTAELTSQEDIDQIGPLADKFIVGADLPPIESPQMAAFVKDMKEHGGPPLDKLELGNDALGWLAMQVLVKVTKGMETINGENIMAALDKANNIDLGPVVPPWTPSKPGPKGFSRISNPTVWIKGYKNGKPYLVIDHPVSISDAIANKF